MRYLFLIFICVLAPLIATAQAKFTTFQNIPGLDNSGSFTIEDYVGALYAIAISLAAILAVIKLIWAGVQYMLSDLVTSKQRAKDDIKGALLGLLIILGAVTILNTINPNLTSLTFLDPNATVNTPQRPGRDTSVSPPPAADEPIGMDQKPGTGEVHVVGPLSVPAGFSEALDTLRANCTDGSIVQTRKLTGELGTWPGSSTQYREYSSTFICVVAE